MNIFKNIIPRSYLAIGYVLLSLFIGNCHPFALESMYNSFPKSAVSFYLSDAGGRLLPIKKYYHFSTSELSHVYNAICESEKIKEEDISKHPGQLRIIGKAMMQQLKQRLFLTPDADTVQLHRITYFLNGESIKSGDILMYEAGSK